MERIDMGRMEMLYNFKYNNKRLEVRFGYDPVLNLLLGEEFEYDNIGNRTDVILNVYDISNNMEELTQEQLNAMGIENVHDINWICNIKDSFIRENIKNISRYKNII